MCLRSSCEPVVTEDKMTEEVNRGKGYGLGVTTKVLYGCVFSGERTTVTVRAKAQLPPKNRFGPTLAWTAKAIEFA